MSAPEKVNKLVASHYKGDWDRYIASWRRYHDSMERSLKNNKPRIVRSLGINLAGKSLEAHVGKIERRIDVLLYLQKNAEAVESRAAQIKASDTPHHIRTAPAPPSPRPVAPGRV